MSEISTISNPICFICGCAGSQLYADLADVLFKAPGKWCFRKCEDPACGLIWLDPRPCDDALGLAYETYFTHGQASPSKGLRNVLYYFYRLMNWFPAVATGLQKHKYTMDRMFLSELPRGKLLDVGCGDGKFLSEMLKDGWLVEGVDFDPKAIETAKARYNLRLYQGDIHDVPFADRTFDAITMKHVIEHVPDPIQFLGKAFRLLKPGGRLTITTPNALSLGHDMFRENWYGLDPPRHLHIFSAVNLSKCAARAGFQVTRTTSSPANADIFIGGSLSISSARRENSTKPAGTGISVGRTLQAAIHGYKELFKWRKAPETGEELVVLCRK